MKKFLLLLSFIALTNAVSAQIHVKEGSFHKIQGFVMLDKNDHYDINDRPMALIKISTENIKAEDRSKFLFKGNLATSFDVQFMPGEIYLYLSTAATFLEIIHPDFGKTEYWLPETLKDFCGYEMVIVSGFKYNDDEEEAKELSNYLIINTDQANAMIYIDDEFVGKNNIKEPLTIGNKYSWRVECPLYHTRSGEVTITEGAPVSIEVKMRPAYGYLNVNTKPEGATLFIDEQEVGTTPYKSDMMQSGTYDITLQKKNHPTKKETVTITDGATTDITIDMSAHNNIFATLNYAFSTAPQHSFGFTFGMVKKFGWYVSAMTGTDFRAMGCDMSCDEFGNIDGEMQFYTDNTISSRLSFIAGAMYRPINIMAIKIGAGYGSRHLAWEMIDGTYVNNTAFCYDGLDLNAGLQFFFGRLSISADYVTTNAKYSEVKIGVGIVF